LYYYPLVVSRVRGYFEGIERVAPLVSELEAFGMIHRQTLGPNFDSTPCPICDQMFSKCGLPNHIRRHKRTAEKPSRDRINHRSPAWWDGWKEGYRLGMRDGRNGERKKGRLATKDS
jgi:hypothetical protein